LYKEGSLLLTFTLHLSTKKEQNISTSKSQMKNLTGKAVFAGAASKFPPNKPLA
jgi:hypothetical protein